MIVTSATVCGHLRWVSHMVLLRSDSGVFHTTMHPASEQTNNLPFSQYAYDSIS